MRRWNVAWLAATAISMLACGSSSSDVPAGSGGGGGQVTTSTSGAGGATGSGGAGGGAFQPIEAESIGPAYDTVTKLVVTDAEIFFSTQKDPVSPDKDLIYGMPLAGGDPKDLVQSQGTALVLADVSKDRLFWSPAGYHVSASALDGSAQTQVQYTFSVPLNLSDVVYMNEPKGVFYGSTLESAQAGDILALPMAGGAATKIAAWNEMYVGAAAEIVFDDTGLFFLDRPETPPRHIVHVADDGTTTTVATRDVYPKALFLSGDDLFWNEDGQFLRMPKTGGTPVKVGRDGIYEDPIVCADDTYLYYVDDPASGAGVVMRLRRDADENAYPEPFIQASHAGPSGEPLGIYELVCRPDAYYMAARLGIDGQSWILRAKR